MTRRERRAKEFGRGKPPVAHPRVEPLMPGPPKFYPDETVLPDDYPVFGDYLYLADGIVVRSDVFGTVADLRRDVGAGEIRRCDIVSRRKALGITGW